MDRHGSKHRNRDVIRIKAEWRRGARTPAWDALWRQILADLNLEDGGDPDRSVSAVLTPSTRRPTAPRTADIGTVTAATERPPKAEGP